VALFAWRLSAARTASRSDELVPPALTTKACAVLAPPFSATGSVPSAFGYSV